MIEQRGRKVRVAGCRRLSAALSAVVVLMLPQAGCSEPHVGNGVAGSDSSSLEVPVPDGFDVYEGDGFAFAHPTDWRRYEDGGRYIAEPIVEFTGPKGARKLPPLIDLFRADGFEGGIQEYAHNFNIGHGTTLPNRTVLRDESATVAGANGARIIESRFDAAPLLDDSDRVANRPLFVRQIDLLVVVSGGVTINLRATAPARDFDSLAATFATVIDSLRVAPNDA
jgi:hypothetical protein